MQEIMFYIEEDVEGGYTAQSREFGVFTQGDTVEELRANIKDAIKCRFEEDELVLQFGRNSIREVLTFQPPLLQIYASQVPN